MDFYRVGGFGRNRAGALFYHLVFESTRRGLHLSHHLAARGGGHGGGKTGAIILNVAGLLGFIAAQQKKGCSQRQRKSYCHDTRVHWRCSQAQGSLRQSLSKVKTGCRIKRVSGVPKG